MQVIEVSIYSLTDVKQLDMFRIVPILLVCIPLSIWGAKKLKMTINGDPNFVIDSAVAGKLPSPVDGSPCTYTVAIKKPPVKISAALSNNTKMPDGAQLLVSLSINNGNGFSKGMQLLQKKTNVLLVSGIQRSASNLAMQYRFIPSINTSEDFNVRVVYNIVKQ